MVDVRFDLDRVRDVVIDQLKADGIEAAATVGEHVVDAVLSVYRGQRVYFPSMKRAGTARRIDAAWREFNGSNMQAVCDKYQVSKTSVYRRLARKRRPRRMVSKGI